MANSIYGNSFAFSTDHMVPAVADPDYRLHNHPADAVHTHTDPAVAVAVAVHNHPAAAGAANAHTHLAAAQELHTPARRDNPVDNLSASHTRTYHPPAAAGFVCA